MEKSDGEKSGSSVTSRVVAVLWTFGKVALTALPIYVSGYYRISSGLLFLGLSLYTGWRHSRDAKQTRLTGALCEQEQELGKSSPDKWDLPSWISVHDVERVEWLNKVLLQVWPFVGQYLQKLLVEQISPTIRATSSHLNTFNFTKINMGSKPLKVVGVKTHTENEKGQVLLDLYVSYVGDVQIEVEVKKYFTTAGVNGIQLRGMMRVILEPLIGDVPIVGAVTMFFIQRPKMDISWTGLTNLLDIPGLNNISDRVIMDSIASFLVLPNRLTVPLVPDLPLFQLRSPLPRGVVRIHLIEAEELISKDTSVKGIMTNMSDPYAILRVGPQCFKSQYVDNTLAPKWNEVYEVIVHEVPGQVLEVEVYDNDPGQDDFLGRTKLDLGIVKTACIVDDWFPLKDVSTGRVHLKLQWLSLLSSAEKLEEVMEKNKTVSIKHAHPPSSAILAIYMDRAKDLPMKKNNTEPNPKVQLSVEDITRESRICYGTTNPVWEDAFFFFIHNPKQQEIKIEVKDSDGVTPLGNVTVPLSSLLTNDGFSVDKWFNLNQPNTSSQIHLNAILRVLWFDEEAALNSSGSSTLSCKPTTRPEHTSPSKNFATEGVLQIHLVEAQNLIAKDKFMGGLVQGKSDPYVKTSVGGMIFNSQVVKSTLNPTWNELYQVVLTEHPHQEVRFELYDKDVNKDDFMGSLKVNLSDIISLQCCDKWYPLNDVKSGSIHLVLEWLPKSVNPAALSQVKRVHSQRTYLNKAVPSLALLFVYLEQAQSLPLKKSGKEPKVGAEIELGNISYKTKVCDPTTSPQWNEAFHFLVLNPKDDILTVKLSHDWKQPLGSVFLPLTHLLSEPGLVVDRWLNLDENAESQILLRAELKILCSKAAESHGDKNRVLSASEHTSDSGGQAEVKPKVEKGPMEESIAALSVPPAPSPPAPVEKKPNDIAAQKVPASSRPSHCSPSPSFAKEGLLRIHLVEAQDLVAKDSHMGSLLKGKSDPYVKITVGPVNFKSHVIKENLNPTWNELYEVVLNKEYGQEVLFELYDKDLDKDDFLGRFTVSLTSFNISQYIDEWFTLNDVKSGRVHLVLEWVPTVVDAKRLEPVLQLQSRQTYQNKAVPSAALLFVYVDQAHDLPLKKSGKEPKVCAELVLGATSYKTKVCDRSTAPQWGEEFHFLLHDPGEDMLVVKLTHTGDQPTGSLVLPVRELLKEPGLVLDRWLNLDGVPAESQILLRAELKILDSRQTHMSKSQEDVVSKPSSTTSVVGKVELSSDVPKKDQSAAVSHQQKQTRDREHSPKEETIAAVPVPPAPSPPVPVEKKPVDTGIQHYTADSRHASKKAEDSSGGEKRIGTGLDSSSSTLESKGPSSSEVTKPEPKAPQTLQSVESTADVPVSPAPSPPASVEKPAHAAAQKVPISTRPSHSSPSPSFATEGVLRIHLVKAQNLVAMDNLMGGMVKGKSDPYAKISVGAVKFRSHVIKENLNPSWNELYEVILTKDPGQEVQIELYDKDLDADDFLGRFKVSLCDIISSQYIDKWFTLNDVKSGRVHLVLEWVPTVVDANRVEPVLRLQSQQTYQNKAVPSAALLFVHVEQASALPLKKSGKEPKVGAELILGGTSYKTKVCDRSTSPQWKESFHFLLPNPTEDILLVKLTHTGDQPTGSLVLPIRELLKEPGLVLDRWMSLDGVPAESQILLRAELKILDSKQGEYSMTQGTLASEVSEFPASAQVQLSVSHSKNKLVITVHGCRHLRDVSEPYVSFILLPDKSKATKRKTTVKKKELNPEYNERFEFDLTLEDARHRQVDVSVKNNVSFMSRERELIGKVLIDLSRVDLTSGAKQWYDLTEESH